MAAAATKPSNPWCGQDEVSAVSTASIYPHIQAYVMTVVGCHYNMLAGFMFAALCLLMLCCFVANTPARMSPRQALEQEMSELAYTEPACVVTATTAASFSHASPSKQVISGVNSSPGSFGSPGTFRKGYYNTAFEESDFITSGRPSSPGQPFAAQHNNLMGNTGTPAGNTGSRPGSGGSTSSTGGVGRLRERL